MQHFATESGKSKGQLLHALRSLTHHGSSDRNQFGHPPRPNDLRPYLRLRVRLLLKAADQAPRGITIYGQEMDNCHLVASLKSRGKGAIILPHGVLFRGNKEAGIRRNLVERGFIKGIIGLPSNLFYGTGIPACILVLDKGNAHARTGIFMIDASKGFLKDGAKNRLRAQDIHKIVDVFNQQTEQPRYSRMVPVTEIASPGKRLQPQYSRAISIRANQRTCTTSMPT